MTSKSRTILVIASLLMGSSVGFGCNKTPTETRQDGLEAQRQADEKAGEAREEAAKDIAEADRDRAAAAADARKTAAEAQANANEKIREGNREALVGDDTPRGWAQAKIDDVDNMIDQATAKAQGAAPKARTEFQNGLERVKRERDALRGDVAALENSTGDRLDKNKEQFSDRVDRIKSNIRTLEKSL